MNTQQTWLQIEQFKFYWMTIAKMFTVQSLDIVDIKEYTILRTRPGETLEFMMEHELIEEYATLTLGLERISNEAKHMLASLYLPGYVDMVPQIIKLTEELNEEREQLISWAHSGDAKHLNGERFIEALIRLSLKARDGLRHISTFKQR